MEILVAAAWFLIAVASDWLSVRWQEAREGGRACACANLAVALEAITWAPILIVWQTGYWLVVPAALAGSWVGSFVAVRGRRG